MFAFKFEVILVCFYVSQAYITDGMTIYVSLSSAYLNVKFAADRSAELIT